MKRKDLDINARNRMGNTALMLAVTKDDEKMVAELLNTKGIDVSIKGSWHMTAFVLAIRLQKVYAVREFLKADGIELETMIGRSSIVDFAKKRGNSRIVKLLLNDRKHFFKINFKKYMSGYSNELMQYIDNHKDKLSEKELKQARRAAAKKNKEDMVARINKILQAKKHETKQDKKRNIMFALGLKKVQESEAKPLWTKAKPEEFNEFVF